MMQILYNDRTQYKHHEDYFYQRISLKNKNHLYFNHVELTILFFHCGTLLLILWLF
jgi:hypothetical protein